MLVHADPVLGDVLGVLDATVLRVAHPHGELSARVSDVEILDRTDPGTVHAGALVLAVGVSPEEGEAVAVVDRAARAAAAAVVFRCAGALPERLRRAGVTLCTVPPEAAWGQLYGLLRTAMAGAGRDAEAAGVRVGDLFALADAVAAAVGAPVTIEDPQWRVLAYSNLDQPIDEPRRQTILGRTPPEVWQRRIDEADVRRSLRSEQGVVRFEHEGLAPRLVAPVRAGGELIGSLWVAEAGAPLGPDACEALLHFADLAAIHLIAHRASDDLKRRARGAAVRELLEGSVPPGAPRLAPPISVLAFEADPGWSGDPERILSVVALYAESAHRDALCAVVGERIWAVVPGVTPRARLVELARQVVERVEHALHVPLAAGIGAGVERMDEIGIARRTAEQALAVRARRSGPRVVDVEEVGAQAALLEVLEAAGAVPGLRSGKLARLLDSGLRDSVRAWLDHHGDIAAAAAALSIHPNTLRYRLRRVAESTGLDFECPEERLAAALALRLEHPPNGARMISSR